MDFPDRDIKFYLRTFERIASKLSGSKANDLFKSSDLLKIIQEYFIVNDATALQFDTINTGAILNDNYTSLIKEYYNRFFFHYGLNQNIANAQFDDKKVVSKLVETIKLKDESALTYLKGEAKLKTQNTFLSFDKHWQNHTENFIKASSFDLKTDNHILHKASSIYGCLNLLGDDPSSDNRRYDIIVYPPSSDDKILLKAYDSAISVLNKAGANKKIIRPEEIDLYSKQIVDEIVRPSLDDEPLGESQDDLPF